MDLAQWTDWLRQHGPALVLAARQWVPDHATAEDILQEAILRFWPGRDRARDPLAMLYICVKRAAIEDRRREQRQVRRQQAAARPDRVEAMFQPVEEDERREHVEAALLQLPEAQREVLVMKFWLGLSFPQIGETLGIPADTAASRYRYGLEKLRASLAREVHP